MTRQAKGVPDWYALTKACAWIDRSTSERMKRATAEFIYDRYVRHPRIDGRCST
jgi:hypothetical protein